MNNKIGIALAAIIMFAITAGNIFAQGNVRHLDPMVAEFSVLEAPRAARFGTVQNPPGGGGPAFFIQNARTGDRRYEIQFVLNELIDATQYNFLVFEMMGSSFNIINDMNEHYPRFRRNGVYVQFQGSFLMRRAVDYDLDGRANHWITISIPIMPWNIHAGRANFQDVMSSVDIFLLRFILESRNQIPGRIYFRNIRLQTEM